MITVRMVLRFGQSLETIKAISAFHWLPDDNIVDGTVQDVSLERFVYTDNIFEPSSPGGSTFVESTTRLVILPDLAKIHASRSRQKIYPPLARQ